jgi:hypothetical protein
MAKFKGRSGSLSGKIGPLVACRWREIDYLRSLPNRNPDTKNHPNIVAKNTRFQLASKFLSAFKDLIKIGYDNSGKQTSYNRAISNLLNTAFTDNYPDVYLDISKIQLSKGPIAEPLIENVTSTVEGRIDFAWTDNSGQDTANAPDKAILVAYCPEFGRAVYTIHGEIRTAESGTLEVPFFTGKQVHTWMAFVTDQNKVSNSVYAGMLTVAW